MGAGAGKEEGATMASTSGAAAAATAAAATTATAATTAATAESRARARTRLATRQSRPDARPNRAGAGAATMTTEDEDDETIADEILGAKSFTKDDFILLCSSLVRVLDIVFLEASQNYTNVYLANGKKVSVRKPISECEDELDPAIFVRTGRSCLVNLNFVKNVEMADAKRLMFVIRDDRHIVLSRKQSIRFRKEKSL
jgi:DNA-binding LytR/AlgR family response regulator